MTEITKITDILTEQELNKNCTTETKCRSTAARYYDTEALGSYSCYNVKTKEVFRIHVVDKVNDTEDYISECFDSVKSSVKYNDQVKSCNAQAMGIEFVDVRDLQKKGFIVLEVHKDETFEEINSTELLLAYIPVVIKPSDIMLREIIMVNFQQFTSETTDEVLKILKKEGIYNIPRSTDINAVSRAISTFLLFNVWVSRKYIKYLDKQAGNVVFRADARIRYYYLGNGVTADFKGEDYDSSNSCEFDMMREYDGGVMESISIACAINKLSKAEEAYIHSIIDTMLKNPSSELNKLYTNTTVKIWLNDKTYFSDRNAIINGPTVEFVKCDKGKAGLFEDRTPKA